MEKKYLIGEAAKYLNMTTDALRYYDKKDIIKPSITGSNGYRYYTIEDIIKIIYLSTLKDIGMSLEDIKKVLNSSSLIDLFDVMEERERDIDEKIEELNKLKITIQNRKKEITTAINNYKTIQIVKSPKFIYHSVRQGITESTNKYVKELEKVKGIESILFSTIVPNDIFLNQKCNQEITEAVSAQITDDKVETPAGYSVFEFTKCLCTVIKVRVEMKKEDLNPLITYIKENNIEIIDKALCRYIAFENKNNEAYDYVEVWLPIN